MARPLGFDPEEAKTALMNIFWARGFDATSMQDIEVATGLKKQSLYRLFGDKHSMYLAALRTYEDCVVAEAERILGQTPGPARARFAALLDWVIRSASDAGDMRGCFLANASAEASAADPETAEVLAEMSGRMAAAFDGALSADARYRDDAGLRRARMRHLLAAYVGLRILVKGAFEEAAVREAADDLLLSI
ncbi:TetR/AcrR family transcriptional regulator [Frigidibacter sp. RF13]|uniref:TetR/AcrR family transcriptional regulator n=1 Tax=Frigidibacter sp. RF13 TaxID=2997340 RepID=UPI00226DF27F|nr:TetR/AcrR family transcriptional regulator [Frigidibacter sp. RF13]MCY1125819.1 TetR/AcrR family transcriptional regulator [Frigidibacter sp. RF13]